MGTWPCGMVVMVGELFGAESKAQVYGNTGPAATVRPVRPWPYRFLREKNGVAWTLTWLAL